MNFFTLLKDEHKEAKDTFQKLLKQDTIDQKETALLCEKLLLHMEMEEKYFYPKVKKIQETEELTMEAKLEHDEAKVQIQALQKGDLDEVERKVKLEMLQLGIMHHVDEEESELFPLAKSHLSDEEVRDISEKMLALKEKSGIQTKK